LPHVVEVSFVGPEIALEMVEAFYEYAGKHSAPLWAKKPRDIDRLVCEDTFHVGLNPATVLRGLDIVFDVDKLTLPHSTEVDVNNIETSLKLLHTIVKKKDFRLRIELSQRRIRLNLWSSYFNMLRPILHAFESEGAEVRIVWSYRHYATSFFSLVAWELNDMIRQNEPVDKDKLKNSLGAEDSIDAGHREYLWEDGSDYNPEQYELEDGPEDDPEDDSVRHELGDESDYDPEDLHEPDSPCSQC